MRGLVESIRRGAHAVALCGMASWAVVLGFVRELPGELPSPVLNNIFPAGGQAGTTVDLAVEGADLDGPAALRFADPRFVSRHGEGGQFTLTIPPEIQPGVYDVRVVGQYGVSGPRAFFVGHRSECREVEPNDAADGAQPVDLDAIVNGRLDKPGDIDCYRFNAQAGQRVVVDVWAERLDSPVLGVVEVYDSAGSRLEVNRGDAGIEPLVDFHVPADGDYCVKLFDRTYQGGSDHIYRMAIDSGPRVEFAVPSVVEAGRPSRVALFGRNLRPSGSSIAGDSATSGPFDRLDVELPPSQAGPLPLTLRPPQTVLDAFPYYHPGSLAPLPIGVTDVPVFRDAADNHYPEQAQPIPFPCEIGGQLTAGDEQDWFTIDALQGEVLWIEALGERIGAPLDLDVVVVDADRRELLRLSDDVRNLGGARFPTNHTDPSGRFVAPADGTYFMLVRNATGGLQADPRRIYRLSVRREEPDFHLTLVSRRADRATGLNLWRGGREMAEVFAVRRRGMTGPIRVAAENLPSGVECAEIWIGPGELVAPVILGAGNSAPPFVGALRLVGRAELGGVEVTRPVRGGTMVRPGYPTGWGRLTEDIAIAIAPEARLSIAAAPGEAAVFQGSILDVAVTVERGVGSDGPIQIAGVGLPQGMENPVATIPAGGRQGWLSFAIPAALPAGPYTIAIQADSEVALNGGRVGVTTFSNPVALRVGEGRIRVTVDPRTPRKIARGQIVQVRYKAERLQGFIGKIHTELAAPGGVVGIRGRGVTFTGQQETGEIQVIATEDAVPGQLVFLRLEAVGTVEDRPVYRGGQFLELEITE